MSRKTLHVALLSGQIVAAGWAFAADSTYPTNPERSIGESIPAIAGVASGQTGSGPASDGWTDVGGEHGIALTPYKYEVVGGRVVHADTFDASAPKPGAVLSREEQMQARALYRNAL